MKFKLLLKPLLLFALLLFAGIAEATTEKYRIMWRDDPATTMVIGWNQVSGSSPAVYYGTTDHGTNWSAYPSFKGVSRSVNAFGMTNNFVRLTGLQPNTAYYFVIKDSQGTSARFWFKTAPDVNTERLSFIAGGDSRNNRTPRVNANKLVAKLRPHAVLFGGDFTDDGTNTQWQDWFDDWQNTIGSDGRMIPIVATRGNHEANNSDVYNLFDVPSTNVYYALTFGGNLIRAYTLNTEMSITGSQTTWLQNDLATNNNVIWKTAQYHKPMRPHVSTKAEGTNQYNSWAALFEQYSVKLVVECDAHTVKTTWPIVPTYGAGNDEGFIRDDCNGTVYAGEGCWGAPLRTNNDAKAWTRAGSAFNQFKWIFVDQQKIELRTIAVDNANSVGQVNDSNIFAPPANLNIWNPSSGSVVTISGAGAPCDDGNACTTGETYDANCNCNGGTIVDSDGDGVCDGTDACPGMNDNIIGTACNDNDSCTTNDAYDANCNCTGTLLDADGDGVCDANDICPTGDDNLDANNNGTPDACEPCPIIDFNANPPISYGGSQDNGTISTQNSSTIELNGNSWKGIALNYTVTANTVIEFDFKSNQIGEIQGVGFDTDLSISSNYTFKVYGTQNWGINNYNTYNGNGAYQHFVIPVGNFYTGQFNYFFFVSDDDANSVANSVFSNIKIYEDANGDLACDVLCTPGDPCDDNNACTTGETYDSNCNCIGGTLVDSDGDGVCDSNDLCPGADDNLIGTACNDNNNCTVNDTYNANCTCAGTFADADNDGVCDANDICPNGDDNIDTNNNGTPDACDNNANNDADGDGVPDSLDICPGGDDNVDSDNDGVPDFCDCEATQNGALSFYVMSGNDDAEQHQSNGTMYLTSTDIELVYDDYQQAGNQYVGLLFRNISIQQGATITSASVQFTVDEADTGAASVTIRAQAVDNAASFSTTAYNISSRATTNASVNWSPPAWTSVGAAGSDQKTSDISTVIQEVINRPGWNPGNNIAIIITGSGVRTAESYNGSPNQGPRININYSYPINMSCDADGDGVNNNVDICPGGDDNVDTDNDGVPDFCDICTAGNDNIDSDNDGTPDACDTCNGTLAGTSCTDNNACTTNDVYDTNCNCAGTYADADNDGVCDANDICANGNDNIDSDNDGTPDACDTCNGTLAGTSCTDNDACTTNDVYDANCNCAGTYADADNDGVCDANDICANGDDNIDSDNDGTPDACDTCNGTLVGTSCNDNDVCTTGDVYDTNCNCAGTYADADNDGVCDANDICPNGDDNIDSDNDGTPDACDTCNGNLAGTTCNDGDPCTVGDVYDANCNCVVGTYIDADADGTCAAEDPDDTDPCIPTPTSTNCNSGSCTTLDNENFDIDWGIWNDGGGDCYRYSGYANSGTRSVRIRDNSGIASSMYTDPLDLSGYTSLGISFSYYPVSMESGEDFFLEISTDGGNTFTLYQEWNSGIEFQNNVRYNEALNVTGITFTTNTVIRFRCDASSNADQIYIDDMLIEGCTGSATANLIVTNHTNDAIAANSTPEDAPALKVYPNPANRYIRMDLSEIVDDTTNEQATVVIYSLEGKPMYAEKMTATQMIEIDIRQLLSNRPYFIKVQVNGKILSNKFVKLDHR